MRAFLARWWPRLAALAAGIGTGWLVAGGLGGLALLGECRGHGRAQESVVAPVVAPPTRAEEKAEPKVVPCVDVQAVEPGKKERKRIAEEYRRPDLAPLAGEFERRLPSVPGQVAVRPAEVVGERELPLLPDGGRALVTLEPEGRVELTVVANPEPFFGVGLEWEVGALYGVGSGSDARWRAWAAAEPLRLGRFRLRLEAGAERRAGQVDAYAMAGAVFRGGTPP